MTTRHLINVVLLALAGYCAFIVGALAMSQHSPFIDWGAGWLVAIAFAAFGAFNWGRGRHAGVIRRIGLSVAVMAVAGVISTPIIEVFGWQRLKGTSPDYRPFLVWLTIFAAVTTMIWFIWVPEKSIKAS